ncbi:hypothetical protein QJQ45_015266 [Haematococcus lacustris]|nr:hypothetical protein QJQ45_015266 [Haematococcus lacustris]
MGQQPHLHEAEGKEGLQGVPQLLLLLPLLSGLTAGAVQGGAAARYQAAATVKSVVGSTQLGSRRALRAAVQVKARSQSKTSLGPSAEPSAGPSHCVARGESFILTKASRLPHTTTPLETLLQPAMSKRCRRSQAAAAAAGNRCGSAPSSSALPPGPSLLDLPTALLDNISSRVLGLGAADVLTRTCFAFFKWALLHAPACTIQLEKQRCDQLLTPRIVAALQTRTIKLALTLRLLPTQSRDAAATEQPLAQEHGQHTEVLGHVLAKLGSCAAVQTCTLSSTEVAARQPLNCTPALAQTFSGLTTLIIHGFSVTCSGLASLINHPPLDMQLQQLDITGSTITQPQQPEQPGAVTLANLFQGSRLKQLGFAVSDVTPLPDLQPLAQYLTQLHIASVPSAHSDWHLGPFTSALVPLTQLRVLTMAADCECDELEDLSELLQALPRLHTLRLPRGSIVGTDNLDELLAATQITNLQLMSVVALTSPRADAPCSWQQLELTGTTGFTTAAYLPLHSLTQPLVLGTLNIEYANYALELFLAGRHSPDIEVGDLLQAAVDNLVLTCPTPVMIKVLQLHMLTDISRSAIQDLVPFLESLQFCDTDEVRLCRMPDASAADIPSLVEMCPGCTALHFKTGNLTPSLEFWHQLVQLMPTVTRVTFFHTEGAATAAMCKSLRLMAKQAWAEWLDITVYTLGALSSSCLAMNKTFNNPLKPAKFRVSFEIHVEGEAAFYRSGCSHTAIGQVTAQMVDVITACKNLKPSQVPLAHRTCAEAAAAAYAVCQRLRGQEPASQLQPMPRLSSTPTQAPAQPGPAHAPCPHHLTDQPPSHPSQLQGSSQHHPALPALLHLPGLSILTRPATNPVTSPAVEQQPIIHITEEQDEETMPPSMRKQQQDGATARSIAAAVLQQIRQVPALLRLLRSQADSATCNATTNVPQPQVLLHECLRVWCLHHRDDERTLVNETRRFFESSLLVMWLEFDDEQQHLEEQWRQNQHQQGGQLQQPPSMRVSLSTFVRLRPPWVARLTASQRQVCVCKTCCNLDNLLTALAQHKKSLQLPPAAAIAAPLAAPLAAAGVAPQPPPLPGGAAPVVAEEEVESLTAAASPFIDPIGEFEQQAHSKSQPLSATAMRQWFLCPCELGQQPSLACSLRTCLHCKSRKLQLQPDADGSVMLTVRQYGKPSSAVGSRPVELLCMRVSLSDAVGMLNKQMPEYIKHHRLAHHQLQVFREHREAVKAGKDGKVVISCDWSEKLTVERSVEIMSEHWHAAQIGILVACAYFKNKEGAYYEHTVYVMTDGKEQSAAITQAAVNQVVCYLLAEHDMDMRQLYMWPSITKPFVAMPMFDQKRDDKHWDDECLTLLCSFAPDSVMQLCTLGKKLSVKMLNEYCKAVGLDINCSRAGSSMYLPPPCFNSCNKDSTGALEMGQARLGCKCHRLLRPAWSQQRAQPVQGLVWSLVALPLGPPQAPCSSPMQQPGSLRARAQPSKRINAEQETELSQPLEGTGKAKGKAAKAKLATQPGRWIDRDCNRDRDRDCCAEHAAHWGGQVAPTGAVLVARAAEASSQGQGVPGARLQAAARPATRGPSAAAACCGKVVCAPFELFSAYNQRMFVTPNPDHSPVTGLTTVQLTAMGGQDTAREAPAPLPACAPPPTTSLLDLPEAVLGDIASRAVGLGAGRAVSLSFRAFSLANLLHAPAFHFPPHRQHCHQLLSARVVSALRARTSKLTLEIGHQPRKEQLAQVLAKLGHCAAVEACKLCFSGPVRRGKVQTLECSPSLAVQLLSSFPGLTALSIQGFSVACKGLAGLLSHPQLSLQLQQLDITGSTITQPQQPEQPGAVTLANLFRGARLKQLSLDTRIWEMPSLQPLAQNLTQLHIGQPCGKYDDAFIAALGPLPLLQLLSVSASQPTASDCMCRSLQQLLLALPCLRSLQLPAAHCLVPGQELDALLAATQLSCLRLKSISWVTTSRADAPCSWQRLELTGRVTHTDLACLPLHSLTQPLLLQELCVRGITEYDDEPDLVAAAVHNLTQACKVPVRIKGLQLNMTACRGLRETVALLQPLHECRCEEVSIYRLDHVCEEGVIPELAPLCRGCTHLSFQRGSLTPSLEFWHQLVQLMPTVHQVTMHFVKGSVTAAMCESLWQMAEQPWARWLHIKVIARTSTPLPSCCQAMHDEMNDSMQPCKLRVSFHEEDGSLGSESESE